MSCNRKYAFQQHGDERGNVGGAEEYNDIPFEIKRVYYMYDTKEGVTWLSRAQITGTDSDLYSRFL